LRSVFTGIALKALRIARLEKLRRQPDACRAATSRCDSAPAPGQFAQAVLGALQPGDQRLRLDRHLWLPSQWSFRRTGTPARSLNRQAFKVLPTAAAHHIIEKGLGDV
jgi:transcriptional regulator of met regulon